MSSTGSLFKVLLVALVIPVIGYGVSSWILGDVSGEAGVNVRLICADPQDDEVRGACDELQPIILLGKASLIAAIIGVAIPLLFWVSAAYAGTSRGRIAAIFPAVLRISLFMIAVMVVLQGAILTYAMYVGESYAIGRVHFVVIGAIGLGALLAGISLIGVAFSFGKRLAITVFGRVLTEKDAPRLYGYVRELADKLGAQPPKNIVVGLEPTFYVTNSDIAIPGQEGAVQGETLFVSAPLARVFSKDELSSVIGHELGHFRGDDTVYSMRFAPVYAGLGNSLGALVSDEEEGASGLAKIPAIAILSYMYDLFAKNVATISRDREHKADLAGADAGSPRALSTALIKVGLYGGLWPHARNQNIERLNQGKVTSNLSTVFEDSAKYDISQESIDDIKATALEHTTPHPTDSHPPVSVRLAALDIDPETITKEDLLPATDSAITLFDGLEGIEEELTNLEHQLMIAYGLVKEPSEESNESGGQLLYAMYSIAAAMVGADGKIEPNEIAVAEGIGQQMFEAFDPIEFRAYCNNLDANPDPVELAGALKDALPEEAKSIVSEYMKAIAKADGEVSEEEQLLMDRIDSALGV